jgi:hypothetical protein
MYGKDKNAVRMTGTKVIKTTPRNWRMNKRKDVSMKNSSLSANRY